MRRQGGHDGVRRDGPGVGGAGCGGCPLGAAGFTKDCWQLREYALSDSSEAPCQRVGTMPSGGWPECSLSEAQARPRALTASGCRGPFEGRRDLPKTAGSCANTRYRIRLKRRARPMARKPPASIKSVPGSGFGTGTYGTIAVVITSISGVRVGTMASGGMVRSAEVASGGTTGMQFVVGAGAGAGATTGAGGGGGGGVGGTTTGVPAPRDLEDGRATGAGVGATTTGAATGGGATGAGMTTGLLTQGTALGAAGVVGWNTGMAMGIGSGVVTVNAA